MAKDFPPTNSSWYGNISNDPPLQNKSTQDGEELYGDEFDDAFDPKADIVPIVLALLIVFVNGSVLLLMFRKKYLRTVTNMLLCSLAFSDLLTGIVCVPLFITCNMVRKAAICITEDQMSRFIAASIVSHLLFATTDRYLAIIHPLRYSTLVTRTRCLLCILFIWSASAFIALIQLSWMDPVNHVTTAEITDGVMRWEFIYDVTFLVLFFAFPFVFMCFTYGRILLEIVRQSRNIQRQSLQSMCSTRKRTRHERKAVAIFAAMLLVYLLCWLPYFTLRRMDAAVLAPALVYVILWLRFLASLLNPCMYILGKRDFRKASFDHPAKITKLELNMTSSSKSTILRATLASAEERNPRVCIRAFSRVDSRRAKNDKDISV